MREPSSVAFEGNGVVFSPASPPPLQALIKRLKITATKTLLPSGTSYPQNNAVFSSRTRKVYILQESIRLFDVPFDLKGCQQLPLKLCQRTVCRRCRSEAKRTERNGGKWV